MPVKRLIATKRFWFILSCTLVLSVAAGVFTAQKSIPPLPPISAKYYNCDSPLSEDPQSLTVYVTDSWLANKLIETLCENKVVNRQFGDVAVMLGSNDFDTFTYINYGLADLALVKQNQINAFASDRVQGYRALARYPDYSAFFIAKTEKPVLSKEYFLGKRIGLLDYPSSRSGHIEPKIQLHALGIDQNNAKILYYNSHEELRRKLLLGDVDIIASYWDQRDNENLSENYKTQISEKVSGSRWFLRQHARNTDLICALQQDLIAISAAHPSSYYTQIDILKVNGVECLNE